MLSTPTLDVRRDSRTAAGLVRRWRQASDPQELAGVYDELHAAGPLVPTPWNALLVTGYADCRQVLADRNWLTLSARWRDVHRPGWRASASTVALCETPLQQDPPEHTARRRALKVALAARAVRGAAELVGPLAAEHVRAFADRVRREGAADLVAAVCLPLPTAVLAGLLGLPADVDQGWLAGESVAMVRVEELGSPPSVVRRADEAATAQLACYDQVLAERAHRPVGDLLSRWAAEDPAGARHLLLTMFSAGVPTTSALLASLALALAIVESAGTWGHEGASMEAHASTVLAEYSADPTGFLGRELLDEHVIDADLVLTATRDHRAQVISMGHSAGLRSFTLKEFTRLVRAIDPATLPDGSVTERAHSLVRAAAALRGWLLAPSAEADEVFDPYGAPLTFFRSIGNEIHSALDPVVTALTGVPAPA